MPGVERGVVGQLFERFEIGPHFARFLRVPARCAPHDTLLPFVPVTFLGAFDVALGREPALRGEEHVGLAPVYQRRNRDRIFFRTRRQPHTKRLTPNLRMMME